MTSTSERDTTGSTPGGTVVPLLVVAPGTDPHVHLWLPEHHSNRVRTLCGLREAYVARAARGFVLDCPTCWRMAESCRGEVVGQMLARLDATVPEGVR